MNKTEKEKQLSQYDFRTFLKIIPTIETMQQINGHNLVFKTLNSGFTVWIKVAEDGDNEPFIPVSYTHLDVYKRQVNSLSTTRYRDYLTRHQKV